MTNVYMIKYSPVTNLYWIYKHKKFLWFTYWSEIDFFLTENDAVDNFKKLCFPETKLKIIN